MVIGFSMVATVSAESGRKHVTPMGKQDCYACHVNVSPTVATEWQESAHAMTGIKCGVCHGDEKNFQSKPLQQQVCIGCHAAEVQHTPEGRSCTSCHPTHRFSVHSKPLRQ